MFETTTRMQDLECLDADGHSDATSNVITHGVDRSAAERPRLRRLPGRACLLRGSDFADSLAGWAAANWNG